MNREQYNSDTRYEKVLHNMDLLSIMDITTTRQHKNGTVVWRLPIKYGPDRFIEVASFATGYVRNQNGGYTNYQLNKRCEGEPEYFPISHPEDNNTQYRKFTTRSCVLIPNEIDRLEYLIGYCLKNYYIKRANEITDGKYVPKWYHENKLENQSNDANHQFELNALQNKLANSVPKWKYDEAMKLGREQDCGHYERINDLENKLATIKRIADVELDN